MVFKGMANKGILDWVLKIVTKIRVMSTQKLCSIRVFLNSFRHKRAEMTQIGWKIPYFVIIAWKIRVFEYPLVKKIKGILSVIFSQKNKGIEYSIQMRSP